MLKKLLFGMGLLVLISFVFWVALLPQLSNKTAKETIAEIADNQDSLTSRQDSAKTLRSGNFKGLNGKEASGLVRIIEINNKKFVRLEEDFRVTNGPDLEIDFGNNSRVNEATQVSKLRANNGGQNYEIPSNINENSYMEIYIYCRALSYPFAVAEISGQ